MGGISIGDLVGTISLNDQFSGPIDKVAKALGVSSQSFSAISSAAGISVGAIAGATAAIVTLGQRGAVVADVQGAFNDLTSAVGSSADSMLGEMQSATLGTVSAFDLMQKSNSLLSSSLLKNERLSERSGS